MINSAVVLCAGRGSRMKSEVQKQYLLLRNKPVIYYSLRRFEDCPFIHEVILVTGKEEVEYCRKEIVERYGFTKVCRIIPGGKERYQSVFEGLQASEKEGYIFIHDGARPFITQELLERLYDAVQEYKACVAAVPVKDTIKISDKDGFSEKTPDRSRLWQVQTPQVFETNLIYQAYCRLLQQNEILATDDAMVLEAMEGMKTKLIQGSYENIKLTTPEDLKIAEVFSGDFE